MQTSGKENGRRQLLGQLVVTVTVAVLCLSLQQTDGRVRDADRREE